MSSSEQSASGGSSGSTGTATSPSNIGYCHECDRQVEIDLDSFTCKRCNGGFIEQFELDQNRANANAENTSTSSSSDGAQPRVFRFDANSANNLEGFSQLLPLLLPQILNPGLNIRTNMPGANNQGSGTTTTQATSAANPNNNNPNANNPTRMGHTRLQFIVPNDNNGNEQFDLYGIINNVVSELLDPRRQQQMGGAQNQFHFAPPPIRMFQLHGDLRDYAWGANGLDGIITQLLNQLENTGPPPASEDQLKNLPLITISEEDVEKNVQCAICMEDFSLNDKAKKLPCKHMFHEPCIGEWLKLHGTCPVCRKNLNGEDTSQNEYIRPPNSANPNASEDNSPSGGTPTSASSNPTSTNTANTYTTTSSSANNPNPDQPQNPIEQLLFGNLFPLPFGNQRNNNNNNNNNPDGSGGNSSNNNNVYHDMDFD